MLKIKNGNLIEMTLNGEFNVIAHGCNCFCVMGKGIAVPMKENFGCNEFTLESPAYKGDINKLGQINGKRVIKNDYEIWVYNAYTQYGLRGERPASYSALSLCMRKLAHVHKNDQIGVPLIGGGLGGLKPQYVKKIMKEEFKDVDATLVLFEDEHNDLLEY